MKLYLLTTILALGLITVGFTNINQVLAQSCGYDDPNPDSYELDEICDKLGYDEDCFRGSELLYHCAERLSDKDLKNLGWTDSDIADMRESAEHHDEYKEAEEYAKEEEEEYEHDEHNYDEEYDSEYAQFGNVDKDRKLFPLEIQIHYTKDLALYGEAELSVEAIDPPYEPIKFYFEGLEHYTQLNPNELDAANNVINFPYWFYDYRPDKTEICLHNLQSDKTECVEAYSDTKSVQVHMLD